MEKNLTKFKIASRHVFCDQGKSLYEKMEVKKSCWIAPLIITPIYEEKNCFTFSTHCSMKSMLNVC
jgi:hypothetical protein